MCIMYWLHCVKKDLWVTASFGGKLRCIVGSPVIEMKKRKSLTPLDEIPEIREMSRRISDADLHCKNK